MKRTIVIAAALVMLMTAAAKAGNWYDKVKLSGDFRHRHELIQDESKDEDRTRWRIRARLMLSAEISENISVGVRLASGSDDPVSTNQSLDGGWSTKPFNLDLAYFDFHPTAVKGLNVIGGKMKLPFQKVQKTELIWDGDLNPEGLAATFMGDLNEKVTVMLGAGFFYVEENSSSDDFRMIGAQGALKVKPADDMHLMAGVGFYDYNIEPGKTPLFFDNEDPFGNTADVVVDGDDTDYFYANDFNQFELLGEFGFKLDKLGFSVYGNYVNNTAADSLNTGYLFGATVKRGKGKGNAKFALNYREIEDDAVIGVFTDSDFRGGGTDGNGFELGLGYGLADKVDLGVSFFMNNKGIDEEVDYKRLQVDIALKF
ncbi:MAG: putative porin [Candidatus Krumholzibacteriota bacterium]|nr:putative porin [Candidatus Krumholzibacteriota bacterium]